MKKVFLLLVTFLIFLHSVSAVFLYQEFANTSIYGQSSNGSYLTYNSSSTGFFNVTYIKPTWALNTSLWQAKINLNTTVAVNYTIPFQCWNASGTNITFQYNSATSSTGVIGCFNSTGSLITISSVEQIAGDNFPASINNGSEMFDGDYNTGSFPDRAGFGANIFTRWSKSTAIKSFYEEGMFWQDGKRAFDPLMNFNNFELFGNNFIDIRGS